MKFNKKLLINNNKGVKVLLKGLREDLLMRIGTIKRIILPILYIALILTGFLLATCIAVILLNLKKVNSIDAIIGIITNMSTMFIYCFLSYNLIRIVKCEVKDIFSSENSKNFKRLGWGMVALALMDVVTNLYMPSNMEILAYGKMSIKPTSLIFLVIGLTNIYLSHVFKEGKRLKEENDLTI